MSSIEVQNLSFEEKEELACSYAMLLLHEIGSEITSDKMQDLLKATNNEVDELTTRCFAKAMQQQNCDSLISNLGAERPTVDTTVVAQKETGKKVIDDTNCFAEAFGTMFQDEEEAQEPQVVIQAQNAIEEEPEDVDMGGLFGDDSY